MKTFCVLFRCCLRKATFKSEVMLLEEIRQVRKRQGLSQEQLAQSSGLSRSSIINFETGKRNPRVKDLIKIANALNVPVVDLISEKD